MFVINEKTKIVDVWADTKINHQRLHSGKYGVVLFDGEVEQAYNGILYAKGFAPTAPQKTYAQLRAEEYPALAEQLDMMYWDKVNNSSNWINKIAEIKGKYPKHEEVNQNSVDTGV